jgi:hypothetical protein
MAKPAPAPPPRISAVLLIVVVLALCVGAAASLVASAASAPSYQPGPIQDYYLTGPELSLAFLAGFLIVVGLFAWIWYDRRKSVPGRAAVTMLVMILALLLFVALLHSVGSTPGPSPSPSSSNPPGQNNSSGASTTTNNSTGIVSTPGNTVGYASLHVPGWAFFVVALVAVLIVLAVVAPILWRRASDPTGRRRTEERAQTEQARGALQTAATALERGEEPREVVIRLYGALLDRVAPIVGGVDVDTPEEIRTTHLVALGIRPGPAATLTRLFEEARYSSHAMGPDSAARASDAIAMARSDLDQLRPVP